MRFCMKLLRKFQHLNMNGDVLDSLTVLPATINDKSRGPIDARSCDWIQSCFQKRLPRSRCQGMMTLSFQN
jgi:hypothetical protein